MLFANQALLFVIPALLFPNTGHSTGDPEFLFIRTKLSSKSGGRMQIMFGKPRATEKLVRRIVGAIATW